MIETDVNYVAVLVAGILTMVVGMIWYARGVFGNKWMGYLRERGIDIEAKMKEGSMAKTMGISFIVALVMAYILAVVLATVGASSPAEAVKVAVLIWAGFMLTNGVNDHIYEHRKIGHVAIGAGYYLVTLVVVALALVLV